MYDRNGLALSPVATSNNAYVFTSLNIRQRKFNAYARMAGARKEFTMLNFGAFNDPRDAAHIAQEFNKAYCKDQIRQMYVDDTFQEIAKEFINNTEIPDWKYPAEGLTVADIECDYGYTDNWVAGPREALVEVIKVFGIKPPPLNEAKVLVQKVSQLVASGMSLRQAARQAVNIA